jgi:hypothetical protein
LDQRLKADGLPNTDEEKDINYACMARIVQEGGFKMVFIVRLSAIPG